MAKKKQPRQIYTTISPAVHARLKEHCVREGRKMRWVADRAIVEWLDRKEKVEG